MSNIALKRVGVVAAVLSSLAAGHAQSYGRSGNVWWDAGQGGMMPWEDEYANAEGQVTVVNRDGAVRAADHPFFEPLGVNGRACVTCHQPSNAMSVSAEALRKRWSETQGKDPVFAAIDGSNCPGLPQEEMGSHSLLLGRGLFRIELPVPRGAEFRIEVVRDPAGCNRGVEGAVSVYRRPRVAANLNSLVAGPDGVRFMADGREPSLESQAATAIRVHEQRSGVVPAELLRKIVEFETQVFVGQSADIRGGLLNEKEGPGALGPQNLATGKAGALGGDLRVGFDVWRLKEGGDSGVQREFRASVARGSDLFLAREFRMGGKARTCASCHAGGGERWMDIGTTNMRAADSHTGDLPVFRVTCDGAAAAHPVWGRVIYTQDPGRAMISGKCADVGSVTMPQFRGLAARAPYFSNGSAASVGDVVEFYDRRFGMGYSEGEKRDLVNFLRVL
jgi:hypothetical protein